MASDPQKPWQDIDLLTQYLNKVSPKLVTGVVQTLKDNCFGTWAAHQIEWAYSPRTGEYYTDLALKPAEYEQCTSAYQELTKQFKKNSILWVIKDGIKNYTLGQMYLNSIHAWEEKSNYLFTDFAKSLQIREETFARNTLTYALLFPGKSIYLAHNYHVRKYPITEHSADSPWLNLSTVGTLLAKTLGKNYKAIGVTGYDVGGMFNYPQFPLPTNTDSLDLQLNQYGVPRLLVDTSSPYIKAKPFWLMMSEDETGGEKIQPQKAYDFVIFLQKSPAAVFLKP